MKKEDKEGKDVKLELDSPFDFKPALKMALLFTVVKIFANGRRCGMVGPDLAVGSNATAKRTKPRLPREVSRPWEILRSVATTPCQSAVVLQPQCLKPPGTYVSSSAMLGSVQYLPTQA